MSISQLKSVGITFECAQNERYVKSMVFTEKWALIIDT